MKKITKFLFRVILGALLLSVSACGSNRKETIFQYVQEHQQSISNIINSTDMKEKKIKQKITEEGQFISISKINQNTISFCMYSDGIVSSGSTEGFYFSAEDKPDAAEYWLSDNDFTLKKENNGYSWNEKNGDNYYYTERICEYFYYYYASN